MANKKYKLTDGNMWATDGIFDFGQNKTQRQINSDLSGAITSATGAIIYPTGDTTDRKAEIEARLSTYGYCEFAEGTFYTSDYISLADGVTICGHGRNSIIICTNNGEGAFALENSVKNITIRDIQIKGTNTSRPTSVGSAGYGIWIGSGLSASITIDNCYFNGLSRCGIQLKSGYSISTMTNISITNCAFKYCGHGIFCDVQGEYANVSNCMFTECCNGASVTGGNNKFNCCVFGSNHYGFVLYDSTSGTNDGHGSAVGCAFNHNDVSISATNIDNGFIFTGCNILYGDITITNSKGIIFTSCIMLGHGDSSGHTDITVTNCAGTIIVDDCIFLYVPTVTVTSSPFFEKRNCRTLSGVEVAPPITSEQLSTTYTANSYVSETDFNRLQFYRLGQEIIARINLSVTTSPGTDFREIGRITLPRNLMDTVTVILSSQDNNSNLMMFINASGVISIYSAGNATGWYRTTFPMILTNP